MQCQTNANQAQLRRNSQASSQRATWRIRNSHLGNSNTNNNCNGYVPRQRNRDSKKDDPQRMRDREREGEGERGQKVNGINGRTFFLAAVGKRNRNSCNATFSLFGCWCLFCCMLHVVHVCMSICLYIVTISSHCSNIQITWNFTDIPCSDSKNSPISNRMLMENCCS